MIREAALVKTFAELADTLVEDFDVVELLTLLADRCVDVLDAAAAGIMLADSAGELRVIASSSDAMRILEVFEVQSADGPCPECYRTGEAVVQEHLSSNTDRWPRFTPKALEAGFRSVQALPMRLRGHAIGALNLFGANEGSLSGADVTAAQAFADVATIAILQHRAASEAQVLNEQLTHALNSRVLVEQAKGMVAERLKLKVEQSFDRLRAHARSRNLRLVDVARDVIEGRLPAEALDPLPPGTGHRI